MRQFEMLQKAAIAGRRHEQAGHRAGGQGGFVRQEIGMIRALYSAASGMRAQEMNVDNIANNLANANTVGYKIAARAVSGPDVPERAAARHRGRTTDGGADRPATGPRHARRVQRNRLHPGRLFGDRQPARRGDSGQRLLPDPAAHGRTGLHARRPVSTGQERQHRHVDPAMRLQPQITIPAGRASRSPSPPTARSATPCPTRPRPSRPARFSSPTSRIRPA